MARTIWVCRPGQDDSGDTSAVRRACADMVRMASATTLIGAFDSRWLWSTSSPTALAAERLKEMARRHFFLTTRRCEALRGMRKAPLECWLQSLDRTSATNTDKQGVPTLSSGALRGFARPACACFAPRPATCKDGSRRFAARELRGLAADRREGGSAQRFACLGPSLMLWVLAHARRAQQPRGNVQGSGQIVGEHVSACLRMVLASGRSELQRWSGVGINGGPLPPPRSLRSSSALRHVRESCRAPRALSERQERSRSLFEAIEEVVCRGGRRGDELIACCCSGTAYGLHLFKPRLGGTWDGRRQELLPPRRGNTMRARRAIAVAEQTVEADLARFAR